MLKLIIVLIIIAGGIYFISRYDHIANALGIDLNKFNSKVKRSNRPQNTNTRFKALLGYGKLISGLGWIFFAVGVLMILFSIDNLI